MTEQRLNVIALTGATGSGKDTLAAELVKDYGYAKLSYGQYLRDLVTQVYGGCTDERDDGYCKHGSFKDAMLYEGKQLSLTSPDFLANEMSNALSKHWLNSMSTPVVITDLRKEIELDILLRTPNLNLWFVEVVRDNNPYQPKRLDNLLSHANRQTGLLKPYVVYNNSTVGDLIDELSWVLESKLPHRT